MKSRASFPALPVFSANFYSRNFRFGKRKSLPDRSGKIFGESERLSSPLFLSRRKSLRGPTGIAPLLLSSAVRPFEQVSRVSQYFTKGAEPRLRLGSGGKAADHREDKFVPQLRRACRSKSCLLGISSSLRPQV